MQEQNGRRDGTSYELTEETQDKKLTQVIMILKRFSLLILLKFCRGERKIISKICCSPAPLHPPSPHHPSERNKQSVHCLRPDSTLIIITAGFLRILFRFSSRRTCIFPAIRLIRNQDDDPHLHHPRISSHEDESFDSHSCCKENSFVEKTVAHYDDTGLGRMKKRAEKKKKGDRRER